MFEYVGFLDIKLNQTVLISGCTYIKEPKWMSHKKATINPQINKVNYVYCFMYTLQFHLIMIK